MAVSKRTRFEVFRRDNYTCRYCRSADNPLTIDHVVPTTLGGSDDPDNLVTACRECNAGKSSSSPDAALVAQVSDDTIRWAKAMRLAASNEEAARALAEEQLKPWFDRWFVWAGPGRSYALPPDVDKRLAEFLAAGLPITQLCEAAVIACRARYVDNRFAYFVGVANNMLAELQTTARRLIDQGEV